MNLALIHVIVIQNVLSAVVLELQNEVLVVSGKDEAATRQSYETLLEHVSSEQLNAA